MTKEYYWIALVHILGIGNTDYKKLVEKFGCVEKIFNASVLELMEIGGITRKKAESIKAFSNRDIVEKQLNSMKRTGAKLITIDDETYPENLKNIYNPPPLLFVKGELRKQDNCSIAIVGSRKATHYGKLAAEKLAKELSSYGVTIVSGMARGIDTIAHKAALDLDGRTIAVLGSGLDVIYPPENKNIYHRISERGAVISEFLFGTKPYSFNFPLRNRIISGLSLGTVVVEAGPKSGALITARFAMEQGREVFAVPGNVYCTQTKGTHGLIRQGAKLVEGIEDILEEISILKKKISEEKEREKKPPLEVSQELRPILDIIGFEPLHIDEIILKTGICSSKISSLLLELEVDGFIKQLPGKRFVRIN